ncbi:MAG: hypothetical protein PHY09_08120 [Desulfuromonadaceae bacterium]|nr:hypothetical protein [Desulfuromonadaceae bacterium]MDD5106289.1 hypothetical protein [Desulfuromonadaceae bacterium]
MEITNFQKVSFSKGDVVAFFDVELGNIKLNNCTLLRNKTNRNFYWNTYTYKYISKTTGKTNLVEIAEIQDEHLKYSILKLAIKSYHSLKTKYKRGD